MLIPDIALLVVCGGRGQWRRFHRYHFQPEIIVFGKLARFDLGIFNLTETQWLRNCSDSPTGVDWKVLRTYEEEGLFSNSWASNAGRRGSRDPMVTSRRFPALRPENTNAVAILPAPLRMSIGLGWLLLKHRLSCIRQWECCPVGSRWPCWWGENRAD